jgi:hypothetical protein
VSPVAPHPTVHDDPSGCRINQTPVLGRQITASPIDRICVTEKVLVGNVSLALSVADIVTNVPGVAVRGIGKGPADAVPEYETVNGSVNKEKPVPDTETVPVAPGLAPVAVQVTEVPGGPEVGKMLVLAVSPVTPNACGDE